MQHCLIWAMECARAGIAPAKVILEQLAEVWAEALDGDTRRAEPWSERRVTELDAMARHAIGKANAKTQAEIDKLHDGIVGIPFNIPPRQVPLIDVDQSPHSFEPVDLGPYLAGTTVRVQPDCLTMSNGRSLLHKGRLNGVHGDSGTGKSWLMVFLISELLYGGEVVALLDLEDTPDPLIDRLRQIGVADDLIRGGVVFVKPDEEFTTANVARLIETIGRRSVTHLILDSLGEAFALDGINENAEAEVAPWFQRVCRTIIDRTGVGITLIDHGTKAAEKPLDPSGSKRKRAAITGTAWLMTASEPFTRTNGGRAELRCAKDRHGQYRRGDLTARLVTGAVGADGRSILKLEPVSVVPPPAGGFDPMTDVKLEILRVGRQARRPLTRPGWMERVHRRAGLKRAAFDELVDDGQIVQVSGGKSPKFDVHSQSNVP